MKTQSPSSYKKPRLVAVCFHVLLFTLFFLHAFPVNNHMAESEQGAPAIVEARMLTHLPQSSSPVPSSPPAKPASTVEPVIEPKEAEPDQNEVLQQQLATKALEKAQVAASEEAKIKEQETTQQQAT